MPSNAPARRWLILAVICLAQLMDVLDVTVVNIALPHAQQDLGFSTGDRQWIVTAYSLAFGSLLLLFGRVSDLVGRRTMLLVGLTGFGLASALGGAAPTFAVLVAARALQGAAGAVLAPAALALLSTTFTHTKERATAFAVFGAVSGSGAAVGMLLGGILTEYLSWRSTLYINVAISVAAIVGATALVPRQAGIHDRPRLDIPGSLLVCTGLFCIVFGFANIEARSWSAPGTWGFLAAGLLLLAVFAWWQTHASEPLLPPRVILDRTRSGANLAIFIGGIGLFGAFLFLNYYMQQILHFRPVVTGLAFLPMVATLVIAGGLCTTWLYPRLGARIPVTAGMVVAAGAMAWLTGIGPDSTYAATVLGPLMLFGVGVGATIAPAMNAGTTGVRPEDAGIASATVNAAQQIGGSIGTALLNSLAASALARYLAGRNTTSQAVQTGAAIHSYVIAFWTTSAIFVAGALICGLVLPDGGARIRQGRRDRRRRRGPHPGLRSRRGRTRHRGPPGGLLVTPFEHENRRVARGWADQRRIDAAIRDGPSSRLRPQARNGRPVAAYRRRPQLRTNAMESSAVRFPTASRQAYRPQ